MNGSPSFFRYPLLYWAMLGGILAAIWMLRGAFLPFFIAVVLAYLFFPVSTWLSRWMSRGLAALVVLLFTVGLGIALFSWLIPMANNQINQLLESAPKWQQAFNTKLGPWLAKHPYWHTKLNHALDKMDLAGPLQGLLWAGSSLLDLFLKTLSMILVPVIFYHLLEEGEGMLKGVAQIIPERHRARSQRIALTIHRRLGGYVRGQLAVACAMSLFHGIAFRILDVPHPWILGMVAGVSNFIPYFPYVSALIPALLLVLLEGGRAPQLLLVGVIFTAVQKIEALYLTPNWVGRATKLHPLEVLLALLAFGHIAGIVGLALAIPSMIVLRVALEEMMEDYSQHPWYTGNHLQEASSIPSQGNSPG